MQFVYQIYISAYKCISRNKRETAVMFLFSALLSFKFENGRIFNSIQYKETNRRPG
jgi:hypothetical protein